MARESRKCLLLYSSPRLAPVQPWGCSGARDIFGTPGPSPQKTTCSFSYRLSGREFPQEFFWANLRTRIPQKQFPVFARVNTGSACIREKINSQYFFLRGIPTKDYLLCDRVASYRIEKPRNPQNRRKIGKK